MISITSQSYYFFFTVLTTKHFTQMWTKMWSRVAWYMWNRVILTAPGSSPAAKDEYLFRYINIGSGEYHGEHPTSIKCALLIYYSLKK